MVTIDVDLQSCPVVAVQPINKSGNETGRVISGKKVVEGRWEQPGLFSVHWS